MYISLRFDVSFNFSLSLCRHDSEFFIKPERTNIKMLFLTGSKVSPQTYRSPQWTLNIIVHLINLKTVSYSGCSWTDARIWYHYWEEVGTVGGCEWGQWATIALTSLMLLGQLLALKLLYVVLFASRCCTRHQLFGGSSDACRVAGRKGQPWQEGFFPSHWSWTLPGEQKWIHKIVLALVQLLTFQFQHWG